IRHPLVRRLSQIRSQIYDRYASAPLAVEDERNHGEKCDSPDDIRRLRTKARKRHFSRMCTQHIVRKAWPALQKRPSSPHGARP
ncbi:hypothetical protein NL349_28610, partial [Klebsiella pneumoniae]|nr:hypothetical protein [Klebsiella pneumoniae]